MWSTGVFGAFWNNVFVLTTLKVLWSTAPIWLPIALAVVLFRLWMSYIRMKFIEQQGSTLLEIKLPIDIHKSPQAMEVFLMSLYQTGAMTVLEALQIGKIRPWFSLELVSVGGAVKFFIWTWPKFKRLIEAQLYAQFPGIEVREVADYTTSIYHGQDIFMWGTYFKLTKPDCYPIRTYIDYGLDSSLIDEEKKIDPIAPVIEYLGSLKKGEQVWIQILIQCHRKEGLPDVRIRQKSDWKAAAHKEIQAIKKRATTKDEEGKERVQLSEVQREAISAIERSLEKFPFEVMMRAIYITDKDAFYGITITGLIGSVRQYSSNGELNGLKLGWFTDFDYPWQDFRRMRRNAMERNMLKAYKLRSFFHQPYKNYKARPFILNTEELATLFHFPGQVSQTPTFDRVVSRKAEAPSNLPI